MTTMKYREESSTESYRRSVALTLSLAAVSGWDLGEGASSISALWTKGNQGGKTREGNGSRRGKARAARSIALDKNRDRPGMYGRR